MCTVHVMTQKSAIASWGHLLYCIKWKVSWQTAASYHPFTFFHPIFSWFLLTSIHFDQRFFKTCISINNEKRGIDWLIKTIQFTAWQMSVFFHSWTIKSTNPCIPIVPINEFPLREKTHLPKSCFIFPLLPCPLLLFSLHSMRPWTYMLVMQETQIQIPAQMWRSWVGWEKCVNLLFIAMSLTASPYTGIAHLQKWMGTSPPPSRTSVLFGTTSSLPAITQNVPCVKVQRVVEIHAEWTLTADCTGSWLNSATACAINPLLFSFLFTEY